MKIGSFFEKVNENITKKKVCKLILKITLDLQFSIISPDPSQSVVITKVNMKLLSSVSKFCVYRSNTSKDFFNAKEKIILML